MDSFAIEKMEVWRAWEKVRAHKGAPGVDAVSLAEFGKDLGNNLYRVWNGGRRGRISRRR